MPIKKLEGSAMKTLILDASDAGDATGERVLFVLRNELRSRNWPIDHVHLPAQQIGNCAGDFFCWIRTPGLCHIDDDNRAIAQAVIGCDLLVYLTPVTFGGYSSELKRVVDHLTQNLLPFFMKVNGEVYHQLRYAHCPKLLVIGWLDSPDANQEAIFHHLVQRNAINMRFAPYVSGVVYADQSDADLAGAIQAWVGEVEHRLSPPPRGLPPVTMARSGETPPQRALLLIGSPRGKQSTSQSLGGYLFEHLNARGIQTETIQLYPALGSQERIRTLLAAIDAPDLIVLAFPLYVDSLPGLVVRAMELIAAQRAGSPMKQTFAAIANCGFPEAKNNQTALAICATFAEKAGFAWAGGLALGAGEAVVNQTPLKELGWRGNTIRAALDLTADNLASGRPIPEEAMMLMAKQRIPKSLFALMGNFGWKQRAKKYGVEKSMRKRPYLS